MPTIPLCYKQGCIAGMPLDTAQQRQPEVDQKEEIARAPTKVNAGERFNNQNGQATEKLTKNQLKKKLRWEKKMEVKKRRKQQEKEAKRAKAKAQGRDLEEERRLQEQRTLSGIGKKRRQELWDKAKLPIIKKSFQVCIDCGYEDLLTPKEISSLALQIRHSYAVNKKSPNPCLLTVSSLGGETRKPLDTVMGFDEWPSRGFFSTDQSLEQHFESNLDNVIYLTSDSENVLENLDDSKIYVIGGIVDRNRLKRKALDRAEALGVKTAKLPLEENLGEMKSTRVLTCNHVFEILLKYREHGNDWKKALHAVLPKRKGAKLKEAAES